MTSLEPWLRGPLPGIPDVLQPAAHALVTAREHVEGAVHPLTPDEWWLQPGGIAPVGFHVAHVAGSTDRLMTYARGEPLSDRQRADLAHERDLAALRPSPDELLARWHGAVAAALEQLASTDEITLPQVRLVGRAQAPSTVLGLLFHAAEHASRHTGQIVTTCKLVLGLRADD